MTSCETDTLSILTNKFPSPSLTYSIKSTVDVYRFWRSWGISAGLITEAECGKRIWTVTQIDGTSPIDSTVFTIDYTVNPMTISAYTTDFSKAAIYNMRVKVEDANYPTIFATKDFTIIVVNPCLTDTLTV